MIAGYFALGIASCPRKLPAPPQVWQCAINWGKGGSPALYCVDSKTNECLKNAKGQCTTLPLNDPNVKGAQCLLADDFKAASGWLDEVNKIAESSCE